eukprot:TRINITY_DN11368_c0_g1_i3.p1 TRINITY_DN11368_c0_g1~~TRINITY_DN11368_c0_g1_i3.p1  ORF type:complete len:766 (-),score=90.21 TRINITY_DN11368_c0_g1_i3:118-2415(-)
MPALNMLNLSSNCLENLEEILELLPSLTTLLELDTRGNPFNSSILSEQFLTSRCNTFSSLNQVPNKETILNYLSEYLGRFAGRVPKVLDGFLIEEGDEPKRQKPLAPPKLQSIDDSFEELTVDHDLRSPEHRETAFGSQTFLSQTPSQTRRDEKPLLRTSIEEPLRNHLDCSLNKSQKADLSGVNFHMSEQRERDTGGGRSSTTVQSDGIIKGVADHLILAYHDNVQRLRKKLHDGLVEMYQVRTEQKTTKAMQIEQSTQKVPLPKTEVSCEVQLQGKDFSANYPSLSSNFFGVQDKGIQAYSSLQSSGGFLQRANRKLEERTIEILNRIQESNDGELEEEEFRLLIVKLLREFNPSATNKVTKYIRTIREHLPMGIMTRSNLEDLLKSGKLLEILTNEQISISMRPTEESFEQRTSIRLDDKSTAKITLANESPDPIETPKLGHSSDYVTLGETVCNNSVSNVCLSSPNIKAIGSSRLNTHVLEELTNDSQMRVSRLGVLNEVSLAVANRESLAASQGNPIRRNSFNNLSITMGDIYDEGMADLVLQILPYLGVPPRPILPRESSLVITKEVSQDSKELLHLKSLLEFSQLELKKALKIYCHNQQNRLQTIVEGKVFGKKGQSDLEPKTGRKSPIKGRPFIVATLSSNTSLSFQERVLLYHAASFETLSSIIESPTAFKDVYKERPGDLIFSHKSKICQRRYKKSLKTREGFHDNTPSKSGQDRRGRWRMLLCEVFLGECHVERTLSFKEFAYIGEIKILELLR